MMPFRTLLASALVSLAIGAVPAASAQTGSGPTPPAGEYCPPPSQFDSANCFYGRAPSGTQAFLYQNGFYHSPVRGPSGPVCTPPTRYDGANCHLGPVPAGYQPFIYQNGWYVGSNPLFLRRIADCPAKTRYDGTGCYRGTAPHGHAAMVLFRSFLFARGLREKCDTLYPGATPYSPLACTIGTVPKGYSAFTKDHKWYVKPKSVSGVGPWRVKTDPNDADPSSRLVCRTDGPSRRWVLAWADEFEVTPDNKPCYTTNDQIQCVEKPYWGWARCAGQPTSYTDAARASWTPAQQALFGGLRDLDKCTWQVFDSFNTWDAGETEENRQSSFQPANIRLEGGVLKMVTRFHPRDSAGYDCGRALNAGENYYTRKCPFSGAHLWSVSGKPWTNGNSPTQPDPDRRYSGRVIGYGRIEFRAKIQAVGQGAWPALWLFVDEKLDPNEGVGELDALEYLAYYQGDPQQILKQRVTYGNALQTAHNWGVPSQNYPHTSEGVGIPISIGEWHTYAVEYEPTEIRFYLDGCLRNRIVEGQVVQFWNSATNAWDQKPFRIPKSQFYSLLIGNAASNAGYLPSWYRAWTDKNATATQGAAGANFRSTELHVDYVRYFTSPDLPTLPVGAATRASAAPGGTPALKAADPGVRAATIPHPRATPKR